MRKLNEFLNESDADFEKEIRYLRKMHPRSGSTEEFITKVSDIISGKIETVERSFFRMKMGDQWGLQFVDDLVEAGILSANKIKGKVFLFSKSFDEYAKTKELLDGKFGFSHKIDKGKFIIEINITEEGFDSNEYSVVDYVKRIKNELVDLNPDKKVVLVETDLNKERLRNRYLSNSVLYKGVITIS